MGDVETCCFMGNAILWVCCNVCHVVLWGLSSYGGCPLMWLVASRSMSSYGACRLIWQDVVLGIMFYMACFPMGYFFL